MSSPKRYTTDSHSERQVLREVIAPAEPPSPDAVEELARSQLTLAIGAASNYVLRLLEDLDLAIETEVYAGISFSVQGSSYLLDFNSIQLFADAGRALHTCRKRGLLPITITVGSSR